MAKHQYATKPPNLSTMPPGVPFLIGNEAAERFSWMRSITVQKNAQTRSSHQ